MKRFLISATGLLLVLLACNEATTGDHDHADQERNSRNTREVYRAIETGDVSKLDSFISEDIVDHEGDLRGGAIRGRDSVKAMLADLHNHVDNLKMDLISEGTSSDGKYHFALVRFTGTAKDASMGAPAGTVFNSLFVDVVRIENGMAVEHWGFRDPAEMAKMMGGGAGPNQADTLKR